MGRRAFEIGKQGKRRLEWMIPFIFGMSGDKQGEFRRALGRLSFLNTMIIHEKKEYIIYFQPMENKGKCKIQVTNGFDFWVEDFDYDKFELKRKKCGLEGTYNSYFDMMSRAVTQRNFEVTVDHMQNFILILYFQLNKGVSLKGEFELGRPLHFDDIKEFHCVYRLFLFDIFKVTCIPLLTQIGKRPRTHAS